MARRCARSRGLVGATRARRDRFARVNERYGAKRLLRISNHSDANRKPRVFSFLLLFLSLFPINYVDLGLTVASIALSQRLIELIRFSYMTRINRKKYDEEMRVNVNINIFAPILHKSCENFSVAIMT